MSMGKNVANSVMAQNVPLDTNLSTNRSAFDIISSCSDFSAVGLSGFPMTRREKADHEAKAPAKLEQRQAAADLHGVQYVRDKQRQIDAIRRFGADVDRSELKGKCDLARLMAPNFRFVECRDVQ